MDTKPDNAVSIIECDMKVWEFPYKTRRTLLLTALVVWFVVWFQCWCHMQVDFAPPVGYKPPDTTHSMETEQVDTQKEVNEGIH